MKIDKLALFCVGTFAVLGTIFSLAVPLLFVAYLDEGIISEPAIGLLSSLNLFGIVMGCLLSLYWFQKVPLLRLAQPVTFMIAILCWLCSLFMENWLIYPNLFVMGTLQGILYARTFSSFANLAKPTEGYAMYQVGLSFFGILCFYAIPRLVPYLGIHAGFYTVSLLALFSFAIALLYRHISFGQNKSEGISLATFKNRKIIGLMIGIMLFQAADMSIWTYLERIAHANAIATSFVSWVLILAFSAGMVVARIIDRVSESKGFKTPMMLGMFITLLMIIRLQFAMDKWEYAVINIIFNMAWVLTYTYMLSVQAKQDQSGKIVTVGVTANFIGEGLGPLITGSLLVFFPLVATSWVAIVLLLLSAAFVFPVFTKDDGSHKRKVSYF